ncbi:hypothetical protein L207DRAFT_514987 [Hyaloscypha variabilis F]|uniref:Uncharacterized protein n=1 Tax=Hyaloscypha variabilis (strain UAMH 11265 / GT02V1 / F) TaxID=1149755 RepID=A0A2J6RD68_HYAVF|nr:hypothetical protein L207DRAFT_514987 [Hyaloscypha variabilis F]
MWGSPILAILTILTILTILAILAIPLQMSSWCSTRDPRCKVRRGLSPLSSWDQQDWRHRVAEPEGPDEPTIHIQPGALSGRYSGFWKHAPDDLRRPAPPPSVICSNLVCMILLLIWLSSSTPRTIRKRPFLQKSICWGMLGAVYL